MKKFISFSGGVESTTMCILYGKGATAIWADTGSEHKKMYERLDLVEKQLTDLHKGDFSIVRLKGDYRGNGLGLEDTVINLKFMPSGQKRYCTNNFKIIPIDKYLLSVGECELMIGLNADEEASREGNWGLNENVHYSYPLIADGHTRDDCEEILNVYGLHPNMPVYMRRGGCRMCFFKSEKEYRAMWFLSNIEFLEVQAFEESIQDRRKKFYSIMGNGKSLRQLAAECEQQKSFMAGADWDELYKSLKKETSCGAFCHR
jgi:3'-phosphoadenosine 5'-phosphosulfate sulfotransferase (PAPS reductase)/FAD synthetase